MTEDRVSDYEVGSPARLALNVLAHKWTLLIVVALKGGPQRFTRLRTLVPGVTSQVLRDSLRDLARDGIVVRQERLDLALDRVLGGLDLGLAGIGCRRHQREASGQGEHLQLRRDQGAPPFHPGRAGFTFAYEAAAASS